MFSNGKTQRSRLSHGASQSAFSQENVKILSSHPHEYLAQTNFPQLPNII